MFEYSRRPSKKVKIGAVTLGGTEPIRVQAYSRTYTGDIEETVKHILQLERIGCELIRVNVIDEASAYALSAIKNRIHIPIIADVLFDDELIIKSIRRGADKIRINPGKFNPEQLKRVVLEARTFGMPIRIGINEGALPQNIVNKYGMTSIGMVEAAMQAIDQIEAIGYDNLIVSLKSTDVMHTIEANMEFAKRSYYPMHIGVTQAGTAVSGLVRNCSATSTLLMAGIGDTVRFPLSGDANVEVLSAHYLLRSLNLRQGPIVLSGSCSRTKLPVEELARRAEDMVKESQLPLRIVVLSSMAEKDEMNMADIGIVADGNNALLYKKGLCIDRVPFAKIMDRMAEEIRNTLSK
jgi:(E)-4-hydroxy-3-methylbut-2-enyl-diphosphate synthase